MTEKKATDLSGIFKEIEGCFPFRKGNLYQNTIRKTRKDGSVRENGPYTIWTRFDGGRMRTSYVKSDDVDRYRKEIENGRRLDVLFGKILDMAEGAAGAEDAGGEKRPRRRRRQ